MLGLNVKIVHEERYDNFYAYLANNQEQSKSTFVVDKTSRTFLIHPDNAPDNEINTLNLVYLKDARDTLSEAEVYRILNYEFEGHILPEIQISDLSVQNIKNSAIEISLKIKNTGKVPLLGINSQKTLTDRIGLNFFQENILVGEYFIDFPHRVIKPSEEIPLHTLIYQLRLKEKDLRVELGLFKDSYGWISEDKLRSKVELKLSAPFIDTKVEITKLDSPDKIIAFTFDGGSNQPPSKGVLEILKETKINASFFLTGSFIKKHSDLTKEILSSGHEIGNHTNSHPLLCFHGDPDPAPDINFKVLERELVGTSDALLELVGEKPSAIWRAPFGAKNTWINSWAYTLGYTHIFWTYDSHDWRIPDQNQPDWTEERVLQNLNAFLKDPPNGSILLFHMSVDYMSPVLKAGMIEAINGLQERGYRFVRVGDLA